MMMTKPIVKSVNSVATFNLSPKTQTSELNVREFDFCTELDCQKSKLPTHRIKVKSNCEKKRFLAKQIHKKSEDGDVVTERTDLDVTKNFVIDYLPLCCDEDWEMIAYSLAKDQPNQMSWGRSTQFGFGAFELKRLDKISFFFLNWLYWTYFVVLYVILFWKYRKNASWFNTPTFWISPSESIHFYSAETFFCGRFWVWSEVLSRESIGSRWKHWPIGLECFRAGKSCHWWLLQDYWLDWWSTLLVIRERFIWS